MEINSLKTLVTLGESTTAGGWSSKPERCWPELLANMISDFQFEPVKLINSGIGANVISTRSPSYNYSGKPAADERLQKHVIDHDPDLVIISYGLNDSRGGTSLEMFREDLMKLISSVKNSCSTLIMLLGPYYMNDFTAGGPVWSNANHDTLQAFNKLISEVSIDTECMYTDVYNAYGDASWMVHYDGVHANDLGHRIIANSVFQTLAQNLPSLALKTKNLEQTSERWRDESMLQSEYGH